MFTKEDMAIRLIEERARLGLTQNGIADKTGKSRGSYINYEMARQEMTVEFLAQLSQIGMDIQYIVTGTKSANINEVIQVPPQTNNIQGNVSNSVFAGSGSTIHQVNTQQHITRTKAAVKPGVEHITDKQKANLQKLVNEIVEYEQKYRTAKSARSFKTVWASLNKHLKVTSYHLIPLEKYETARKYLQQWIGRLTSTKTAIKIDNNNVRKRQYSYIYTNIEKLGIEEWYRKYLNDKFSVDSPKELNDTQLRQVYQAVAYQVRKHKSKQ